MSINANELIILNLIRDNNKINKSKISELANVSIPTAMKFTDKLVSKGFVRYCGQSESRGGRTSELYEFAGSNFYSIGIDISPTAIKIILMDLDGTIYFKNKVCIKASNEPSAVTQQIATLIKTLLESTTVDISKILGIGIGMPGILDIEAGSVLFSPNFHWENVKLLELIKKHLYIDIPIYLENTNRAAALAEKYFGSCKELDSFVCINIGYGIGSAIYNDNDIYRGASGTSGEIGHITVEKDGILCTCGNNGCLEALASGRAIEQQAKNLIISGVKSKILNLANNNNIEEISTETVFQASRIKDSAALDLIQKAIEYIAIGIATYINLFDPKKIVLIGGMSNESDFVDEIKKSVSKRQMNFSGRKVEITVSDMGAYSTAVGAASIILINFLKMEINISNLGRYAV